MTEAHFRGTVKNGKLPRLTTEGIVAALRKLEGCTAEVTVKKWVKRRSGNQNRYYWSVVVRMVTEMFREAGNYVDDEEVHEFLKLRVGKLSQNVVDPHGEVYKTLGSTTKLSTTEFEAYMMKIKAWAAEFGLQIPEPNEDVQSTSKGGNNE